MPISPTMQAALQTAITNWHQATRAYEQAGRVFADAETQMRIAQSDLHELARAIEVVTGEPAGELVTGVDSPIGAVTMPVVPGPMIGANPAPADDGLDAAAIVLEQMRAGRIGV